MIKKIFKILKKLILAVLLIYGYNVIVAPLAIIVPINLVTVSLVTILGVPAMMAVVLFLQMMI